jgi:hypothetical protein
MFTPLFRLFAGWATVALVFAFLFGVASNADHPFTFGGDFPYVHNTDLVNSVLGPLSLGWKGPVGNHLGYTIWVAVAAITAVLAGILIAFRDADPEAEAQAVQLESVPLTRAPAGASYLPVLGAIGAGLLLIGWVANYVVFLVGIAVIAATAVVWTFRAWAERATGDDEVNLAIYHRFIDPMRIPVLALVLIGLFVFDLSQVLKAVSREASIVIFLAAFVFLGVVFTVLAVVKATKPVVISVFLFLAALLIGVGIWASIAGEREFHHGPAPAGSHGGEGGGTTEGGGHG